MPVKKLGVSSTAIEVINGRWTMDVFGMGKDTASVNATVGDTDFTDSH